MDKVIKTWGWEHWFANTDDYCGKLIYVECGKYSSEGLYHFHKIKDETFHVLDGDLRLEYYVEGIRTKILLQHGDSFRVHPGTKHRFTAGPSGCTFVEVSTTHSDSDSYRCEFVDGRWQVRRPKMVFCIDIDGTICSQATGCGYTDAEPDVEMVARINQLYDAGHTIKIATARGQASGVEYIDLTRRQLKEWGVKYHELMTKPAADWYVDDKAVLPGVFLNYPLEGK